MILMVMMIPYNNKLPLQSTYYLDYCNLKGFHKSSHNHNISSTNQSTLERSTNNMKLMIALVTLASTSAFTMNGHSALMTRASMQKTALMMSSVDDEVAALRAAAQKAREDAQKLAKVSHFYLTYFYHDHLETNELL